jgi:hypothetical protein
MKKIAWKFQRHGNLLKGLEIMKFGDLIKIFNTSKLFKCKRNIIAYNLVKAGGITKQIDPDSFGKWIDEKVPDNITDYFPDGKVNEDEVIKYFKRWTKNEWNKLKEIFSSINDDFSEVVYKIDNHDAFCQSLCYQFIITLGLLPSEELENDMLSISEDSVSPVVDEVSKQMLKIFNQATQECDLENYDDSDKEVIIDEYETIDLTIEGLPVMVNDFLETIKTNIIEPFRDYGDSDHPVYEKIKEFCSNLVNSVIS